MRGCGLVLSFLIGCGRLGFDSRGTDAVPPVDDSAQPQDGGTATLAGSTTCQPSPATLTLDRDAETGQTLLVALFLREPSNLTLPTISGVGTIWETDAAFTSVSGSNRRHFSLFRLPLLAPAPVGSQLSITHPDVQSSGAAVFILPGGVAPAGPAAGNEGTGPFSGPTTTTAAATLCAVVHHNGASATFSPEWGAFFDLGSDCTGEARQSAGMHLRVGPGGSVDCAGMLSNDSFAWITVVVGYDGFP